MADLVIIFSGTKLSDFPTAINGQMALQANTGQLWGYLNDKWTPLTGTKSFTVLNPYSVYISGIGRDCQIENGSVKITKNLTSKIDTFGFKLFDDGDYSIRSIVGQQVDIFEYASTTKRLSGEISTITQSEEGVGTKFFTYNINGVDFTKRLNKRLITASYTNQKAGDIIKNIVDNYFTEFSYINVEDGPTIDYIEFNYITATQAFKKIAKITGYDWYIDPIKDIHFFLPATNYAPYEITENLSTSGKYSNLRITIDKTNYRNRVIVQGGYKLEAFNDDIQVADGEKTTFNLAYEPFSPVAVYVDSGSGFVQKTIGIDNIHTSGYDFVVNQSERLVRNLDFAKLNNGDKIKVTYNKRVKIIVTRENTASQTAIQAIEGGDGIYEYRINDNTIASEQAAIDRADAEIEDYKEAQIKGTFNTNQVGYEEGQILKVNLPSWGLENKEYKIQSISINPKTPNGYDDRAYTKYTITFRAFERSYLQFMLNLYDNSVNKEIIVKGDEKPVT